MSSSVAPVRFGIVGCGAIGPTHAGAVAQIEGASVVAVSDVVGPRARAMADKFGVGRVYADQQELFDDPDVDVVCLCTPSGMHADGAVAALQAGKHVIIEKPMEITLAACDRIIAEAERAKRKVTVISQHRFDTASMVVKDLITSGRLGKIVMVTADVKWWRTQQYYDSGDWRGTWKLDGGGCLMNQGVHTVDLVQWLGGRVTQVFGHARTAAHERIEVEDVAAATFTFASGAIGTIVASTASYPGFPVRIDIYGTEGSAVLEGDRLKTVTLKDGTTFASEEAAEHALSVARGGTNSVKDEAATRPKAAPVGAVWGDAHREQLRDFIRAIRTGGEPLITPRDARHPVEIILGVYESSRTGQPVTL
jgi:UDP-N-acetyl-2-amino-2-deoxyglucuronate dehydrogenase